VFLERLPMDTKANISRIKQTFSNTRDIVLDTYLDGEVSKGEMKSIILWCNKMEEKQITSILQARHG